jgi:hypothetical protein
MAKSPAQRPPIRVHDRVRVRLGGRPVDAFVIEDRGWIGVGGRRLLVLEVPADPLEPMTLEVPEDELELSDQGGTTKAVAAGPAVEYLKHGGLIAILRANSGGRSQPRVWLRYDSLGNVTHTFIHAPGLVGGATIPFFACHDDKIFTPKTDEVRSFLKTFNLDDQQVAEVIKAVGTAP